MKNPGKILESRPTTLYILKIRGKFWIDMDYTVYLCYNRHIDADSSGTGEAGGQVFTSTKTIFVARTIEKVQSRHNGSIFMYVASRRACLASLRGRSFDKAYWVGEGDFALIEDPEHAVQGASMQELEGAVNVVLATSPGKTVAQFQPVRYTLLQVFCEQHPMEWRDIP